MNDCKNKNYILKKVYHKTKAKRKHIFRNFVRFSIDKRLFEMYYVTTITTNTCSEIQEVVL